MMGLLTGCGKPDLHDAVPEVFTDAATLTKDYARNGVTADEDYKGHVIEVSGEVVSVDNVLGEPTVTLKGDDGGRVQCGFSNDKGVGELSSGKTAKIKGVCNGNVIWVGMSDCVLD